MLCSWVSVEAIDQDKPALIYFFFSPSHGLRLSSEHALE